MPILTGNAVDLHRWGPGAVDFCGAVAAFLAGILGAGQRRDGPGPVADEPRATTASPTARCGTSATRPLQQIQSLPLSYLDGHPTGEVVSRVIADVDQFADGLLMGFTQLFTGRAHHRGHAGVHALRSTWSSPLVVVVITPLSLLVAAFIAKRTYRHVHGCNPGARGEQTGFIEEMVRAIRRWCRPLARRQDSQEQFDEINERLRKCSLRAIFFSSITNPSTRFVNSLVYAGVGMVGALVR